MKLKYYPFLLLPVAFLACQNGENDSSEIRKASADSTNALYPTKAEISGELKREFIRTADIKFKVQDVVSATNEIEEIARELGGFVTQSNLETKMDNRTLISMSEDSTLESTTYTMTNKILLRVPNGNFDSTMKRISSVVDFLDYRNISADDVSMRLLGNRLLTDRTKQNESRMITAIENKNSKLRETVSAEETILKSQETRDEAKLANLSMKDQVDYSTISVSIYQPPILSRQMVYNQDNMRQYEPGFTERLVSAFEGGLSMLEDLIIFLTRIWLPVLIAVTLFFVYRKYSKLKTN